jgi:hypothetical protein
MSDLMQLLDFVRTYLDDLLVISSGTLDAAVCQNEDQMAEATIGALSNLATATAADRCVVAALTQANSRLANHLEDNSNELRELKALLKKDRSEKRGQRIFPPPPAIIVGRMATKLVALT